MSVSIVARVVPVIFGLTAAVQASAAYVVYTDQTAFNAAAGSALVIEDLETDSGSGSPIALTGTALTQVSSDANQIFSIGAASFGGQALSIQDSGSWTTNFTFSTAMSAFAFEAIDYFEFAGASLSFSTSAGESGTFMTAGPLANLNQQYLGLVTDQHFTSISITGSHGDGAEYDNFTYAAPEPAGIGLLGMVGLWLARRRVQAAR